MMKKMKTNYDLARVAMTLAVLICSLTTAWADDVTAEQAREQAQRFMQQHRIASGKTNKVSPSKNLSMTMTQMNGLYVFNMAEDGGFVIVSNDDRTTPILGFSDSGSIDPDNMPSNMKAWLKGYADEIAWLQKNGNKSETKKGIAKTSPSWNVGDPKTNIDPLLTTQWNQGEPYNNFCPEYAAGQKSATGCVATAMAQVIYYHQWPKTATPTIPAYTDGYGVERAGLPAITFDWANMITDYSGEYSEENQNAVATLMLYCGWGAKMNYGPESESNLDKAATALKEYFDYQKETIKHLSRSFYSYANWIDLIYYELSQGRPVIYSGESSNSAHAFVCDGYQYVNETDFFHINWGWGGLSDDYFVLSALNPDEQGIGGSTSTDGYRYGQHTIIGIQPASKNNPIAAITPNIVDLQLNSMTPNSNLVGVGVPVTITLNITNNSKDAYDGDIYLGRKVGGDYLLLTGNNAFIQAGETKDCHITLTPTEIGIYDLCFYLPDNYSAFYTTDTKIWTSINVVASGLPTDLTASTITPTSATITWTSDANVTSYTLRYKNTFLYDFETAMPWAVDNFTPCTTYDGDGLQTYKIEGSTFTNQQYTGSAIVFQNDFDDNPGFTAHSGNAFGCFMDAIPETNVSSNNDWFILPEMTIKNGDTFSFWARSYTDAYGLERFKVGVYGSTDGTFASYLDGSATTYVEAPTKWTEYRYDLSAYTDQSIRLAINCVSKDAFAFFIDDIRVENGDAWTTITDATSPCKFTGLEAATTYEYQLQASYNEAKSQWTESATFTTLNGIALDDDAANYASVIESNNKQTTNVVLEGRTLWKDGGWNTLCLPFNVDLTAEGCPLAGAIALPLTTANITNGTLNLTFGDPVKTLTAGTPYIIKWESGTNIVDPVFMGVTINKTMNNYDNEATGEGRVRFIGTYDNISFSSDDTSILFMGDANKLYYPESGATIGACRAYMKIGEDAATTRTITDFNFNFGDEETGITLVEEQKVESDGWYTLTGVKLKGQPTQKGVYIHNGRQVFVK